MTLTQIAQAIAYAVVDNGGTDEDTKRILSDERLRNEIAGLILGITKVVTGPILFPLLRDKPLSFDACGGTRTMANAKDVFTGWVDNDWKNYGLSNAGPATIATPARMYELSKNARFKEMFLSLSFPLDAMCVTESQYIGFAEKYPHLLGEYGTFMLVKKDWSKPAMQLIDGVENFDNVFVARAYRYFEYFDGLNVYVDRFEYAHDWDADGHHRVVVPQLGTSQL